MKHGIGSSSGAQEAAAAKRRRRRVPSRLPPVPTQTQSGLRRRHARMSVRDFTALTRIAHARLRSQHNQHKTSSSYDEFATTGFPWTDNLLYKWQWRFGRMTIVRCFKNNVVE